MGINTHVANALRPPSTESGLKRVQVVPSGLRPTVSMPSSAQNFRKSQLDSPKKIEKDALSASHSDSDSSEGDVAALFAQMRQKVANNEISDDDDASDAHTVKNRNAKNLNGTQTSFL